MPIVKLSAVLGLALVVSGCLSPDGERAVVGAGAGAVGAAILDLDPVTGAAVGAAAGALCDDAGVCRR